MLHFLSGLSKAFQWPSILAHLLNLFCFLLNPTYFNNTVVSLKYINFHDLPAWCPSPNSRTVAHLRRGKIGCLCWQLLGSLEFWCLPTMTQWLNHPGIWLQLPECLKTFTSLHTKVIHWTELHDFWKNVFVCKKCLLIFTTPCAWNMLHSKNWVRYYYECT